MSQSSDMNNKLNSIGVTAKDNYGKAVASTTGPGHPAKVDNAYGSQTAGRPGGAGSPSSTVNGPAQAENKLVSGATGLGGGKPRGGHS